MSEIVLTVLASLLLAIGLALCTYLFVTLKQEVHQLRKETRNQPHELRGELDILRDELDHLRRDVAELDRRTGEIPQLAPPRPGMNTSRRSQVLRMHRRGERPEQIATALGIAQGEVDLLLKVHQAAQPA